MKAIEPKRILRLSKTTCLNLINLAIPREMATFDCLCFAKLTRLSSLLPSTSSTNFPDFGTKFLGFNTSSKCHCPLFEKYQELKSFVQLHSKARFESECASAHRPTAPKPWIHSCKKKDVKSNLFPGSVFVIENAKSYSKARLEAAPNIVTFAPV